MSPYYSEWQSWSPKGDDTFWILISIALSLAAVLFITLVLRLRPFPLLLLF